MQPSMDKAGTSLIDKPLKVYYNLIKEIAYRNKILGGRFWCIYGTLKFVLFF